MFGGMMALVPTTTIFPCAIRLAFQALDDRPGQQVDFYGTSSRSRLLLLRSVTPERPSLAGAMDAAQSTILTGCAINRMGIASIRFDKE